MSGVFWQGRMGHHPLRKGRIASSRPDTGSGSGGSSHDHKVPQNLPDNHYQKDGDSDCHDGGEKPEDYDQFFNECCFHKISSFHCCPLLPFIAPRAYPTRFSISNNLHPVSSHGFLETRIFREMGVGLVTTFIPVAGEIKAFAHHKVSPSTPSRFGHPVAKGGGGKGLRFFKENGDSGDFS